MGLAEIFDRKSMKKQNAFLAIPVHRYHIADLLEYFLHFCSATWTRLQLLTNFPNGSRQKPDGRKKSSHT